MSLVWDIQERAAARLGQLDHFVGTTILTRRVHDILSNIEANVAQIGRAVFVFPPIPETANPELPGPYFDVITLRVRCIEDPKINQGNVNAYTMAEAVLQGLHNWDPGLDQCGTFFVRRNAQEDAEDPKRVIFDCLFQATAAYTPNP